MTLSACASCAAIDRGVTVAIDANAASAVCWIMAATAGAMNRGDNVAGVAADAEAGGSDSEGMAMIVAVEIKRVTASACRTADDGRDMRSVRHILESWRRGVTVGTATFVNCHRAVGWMAYCHACWCVFDDTVPGNRVVNCAMRCANAFILMTVEAVDSAGAVA